MLLISQKTIKKKNVYQHFKLYQTKIKNKYEASLKEIISFINLKPETPS